MALAWPLRVEEDAPWPTMRCWEDKGSIAAGGRGERHAYRGNGCQKIPGIRTSGKSRLCELSDWVILP